MIKRRIPMIPFMTAVYAMLSNYQNTCPVYDKVLQDVMKPYATIGEFTYKQDGAKDVDMGAISQQIHIWSDYDGKAEVNTIANEFTEILTGYLLDLSASGFLVTAQDVDMFEAFQDSIEGFHGVLTLTAQVQNIGGA
jgi:hypothetical protein